MEKHLLKKEWEVYIQDYKNSGLSKVAWCKKRTYRLIGFTIG
ncbi:MULTISPECIES: hypothetical protein [Bacillus]|nr:MULTISPECIES: hypothetical protein [Bacillus]MED1412497.1 hypothetical protein [Bacillus paramycoides]MED1466683.1 hypothetical protein [Bacillus paramycoides]MED1495528.1 hypothetical protein [Bacillus paramycoides]